VPVWSVVYFRRRFFNGNLRLSNDAKIARVTPRAWFQRPLCLESLCYLVKLYLIHYGSFVEAQQGNKQNFFRHITFYRWTIFSLILMLRLEYGVYSRLLSAYCVFSEKIQHIAIVLNDTCKVRRKNFLRTLRIPAIPAHLTPFLKHQSSLTLRTDRSKAVLGGGHKRFQQFAQLGG